MARRLRRDHRHVDVCRDVERAEADVEAVREHQRLALGEVRPDRLAIQLRRRCPGTSTMITSAHADAAAGSTTVSPSAAAFARDCSTRAARRGRRRRCRAGSARARVPAIHSQESRPSALDQSEVGVGVVIDLRHCSPRREKASGIRSRGLVPDSSDSRTRPACDRLHRIRHVRFSVGNGGRRAALVVGCRRRAPSRRGRCAPFRARRRDAARPAGHRSWLPMPAISITSDAGATSTTRAPKTSASCRSAGRLCASALTLISARSRTTAGRSVMSSTRTT